jgi:heat shock protein HslJ
MTMTRIALALLASLGLITASCGDDSEPVADSVPDVTLPTPDDDVPDEALDGPWVLVSGSVDGAPVALVDGWDVTLTIEGSQVGGRAACNGYGGTLDTAGGTFIVGDLSWTEMGCEPAVMELEQAYLRSLSGIDSHTLTEGRLTITGAGAEWVFEAAVPVPDAEIVGTAWVLDTYLDGEAASNMPMMELATLTFNADGILTGSTSCRQLVGEWITSGATVQFTSFSAIDDPTAGVCAPESETLDGLIISVLESGFTVEIDGNRMTLMAPGDEGLSYAAR